MTQVGRRKLDHPALGTASNTGALHASIESIYTVISNDLGSRYAAYTSVANTTTSVVSHDFGVAFAELNVYLFTGTYPNLTKVSDPVASGWTIVANGTNPKTQIDVSTPGSGGPHTFVVFISQGAIEASRITTELANASKFISRDASGVITQTKAVPTGVVVGTTDTQNLTNKNLASATNVLTGASADSLTTVTGTRTITLPTTGNTTLVGTDQAQVLTAKDIDGGTASNTSRITAPKNSTANLNALTRKEGTIVYDSSTAEVKYDNGVSLVALGASTSIDSPRDLENITIACSVGSSALTIALKNKAGNDPSVGDPVKIGFRNATSANGTYAVRSSTAATSLVISSGSTLGTRSTEADYLYVYAIDNAGTIELGISRTCFDDGTIRSTTAEGGAGAADSNRLIYSTTARTNVPVRLVARLKSTQTTAGTWASVPTEIAVGNFHRDLPQCSVIMTANQSIPGGSADTKITNFSVLQWDNMGGYDTSIARYTVPVTGVYFIQIAINFDSATSAISAKVFVNGSTEAIRNYSEIGSGMVARIPIIATGMITLSAGDYIEPFCNHASGANRNVTTGAGLQIPTFTIQMVSLI